MRAIRFVPLQVVLGSALWLAVAPAAHAAGVEISYQVTGGAFGGPPAVGAITGKALSVVYPAATNTASGMGILSLRQILLTGASGTVVWSPPPSLMGLPGTGTFTPGKHVFTVMACCTFTPFLSKGPITTATLLLNPLVSLKATLGIGTVTAAWNAKGGTGWFPTHTFTVGSEVRALIPGHVPSMSAAGVAAAVILMLLATGYVFQRRFSREREL